MNTGYTPHSMYSGRWGEEVAESTKTSRSSTGALWFTGSDITLKAGKSYKLEIIMNSSGNTYTANRYVKYGCVFKPVYLKNGVYPKSSARMTNNYSGSSAQYYKGVQTSSGNIIAGSDIKYYNALTVYTSDNWGNGKTITQRFNNVTEDITFKVGLFFGHNLTSDNTNINDYTSSNSAAVNLKLSCKQVRLITY